MDDRNAIRERGRSFEEEWARRWAREAVERLRVGRNEEEERRRLAETTGIRSPELLGRMRDLGLDADSASLLFLVPVIGMAAADGAVSHEERNVVKGLARRGGIAPGSRASAMLDGWLHDPPAGEVLDRMLDVVRDVLAAMPQQQADEIRTRMHGALDRVGRASGGVFGIGALSRAERRFMARVASAG